MDGRPFSNIAKRTARAFCVALCARSALKLLKRLPSRPLLRLSVSDLLDGRPTTDDCRFPLFLSFYSASYQIIDKLLHFCRRTRDGCNAIVAASLAGPSIILLDSSDGHTIVLFALARSLEALFNTSIKRGYLKQLPFGTLILFSVCHCIVCCAVLRKPNLLPKSYYKALLKYSECFDDNIASVMFRQSTYVPCERILHKGMSCWQHITYTAIRIFAQFVKFYSVLYGVGVIMQPKILRKPVSTFKTLARRL
ncbi:uncharacterized protein LOC134197318 isoform X2 [Corticium candelabrum]|uniref:uncharacterized protein LOC134197318 isoform X2 n=1 Tax=Corticium candelabrum TaxID=121492 RepID=UPI002E2701E6|nr:uncharacterized protein LOC134197318 isoform X2 [Corticium candelabrum]